MKMTPEQAMVIASAAANDLTVNPISMGQSKQNVCSMFKMDMDSLRLLWQQKRKVADTYQDDKFLFAKTREQLKREEELELLETILSVRFKDQQEQEEQEKRAKEALEKIKLAKKFDQKSLEKQIEAMTDEERANFIAEQQKYLQK